MLDTETIPQPRPEKSIELADLLAFYPDTDDVRIQEKITAKKEFRELASTPEERLNGRKYYKHQLLVQRILQEYHELLLFHDTGTGKSRILDLIGEYFRLNRRKPDTMVQKVLVLVRSDILKSEIERQIVKGCSDGTYDFEEEYFPSTRKKAVRKEIEKWYEIVGYQKFARELEKKDDATVRNLYSNTLIFFDEVHNLRIEHSERSETIEDLQRSESTKTRSTDEFKKRRIYDQIYRVFHLPHNVKRILATATPMINDVSEVGPLMNLILPKEKQFPPDFPYETGTLKEYEPYFRGRISYVRSLDTGINVQKIGIPVTEIPGYQYEGHFQNPQIKVFANYMSAFQNEAYRKAMHPQRKRKTFYHAERQAANFVYPDGSWGAKGFRNYTEKMGSMYYPTPDFEAAMSTLEGIRNMGVKVASMIEIAERVGAEGGTPPGNVYIYDNFVEASGAITIALCFQAMGYEIFNESRSVFHPATLSSRKRIRNGFVKKKRVALFTGMTSESMFAAMLELMNAPENYHGEYLKVFITSPTGSEGISLNNVVSIHIGSGDWKYATPHQAESRPIRSTSHEDLLQEKRELYQRCGLDPSTARIDVEVYYHVAISRDIPARSIDAYLYTLAESKDRAIKRVQRFMKQVAIDSQIHQQRNVRATDRPGTMESDYVSVLGREKETLLEDRFIDHTTYDVYYMHEPVAVITNLLQAHFRLHFSITVEGACEALFRERRERSHPGDHRWDIPPRRKYVIFAVEKMIAEKTPMVDRYGHTCYLEKDGNTLFLVREYRMDGDIEEEEKRYCARYYTENMIALRPISLRKIKSTIQVEQETQTVNELKGFMGRPEQFRDYIHQIPIETCAKLLENAIYQRLYSDKVTIDPKEKEFNAFLLQHFALHNEPQDRKPSVYYSLPEPLTEIRKLKEELVKKEQGRGRKPKYGIRRVKSKHYDPAHLYQWDIDSEKVYVHTLYTLQRTKTRYADKTRYFKVNSRLRILKSNEYQPSNGEIPLGIRYASSTSRFARWRDATPEEAVIYSLWIQRELHRFKQQFESRSLVYGYYLGDQALTIRNKIDEDPDAHEDKRKLKTGRVCSNITPPVLVKILEYLDVPPPQTVDAGVSEETLLHHIVETKGFHALEEEIHMYPLERLRYFASWILVSKSILCKRIQETLQERDLLFRTL